jgi:hypothetical protein
MSCTLPTAERPLRAAEWDDLLASAATAVRRTAAQQAAVRLRPDPAVAARAGDLAVRETQCCSFFTFGLMASGGGLELTVTVPPAQTAVLDALLEQAARAVTGGHGD